MLVYMLEEGSLWKTQNVNQLNGTFIMQNTLPRRKLRPIWQRRMFANCCECRTPSCSPIAGDRSVARFLLASKRTASPGRREYLREDGSKLCHYYVILDIKYGNNRKLGRLINPFG